MALAAQAYAKSELLWYFRHVGDKLPPPPTTPAASKLTGQLLGQAGAKSTQLADDGQVVALVAAAAALYDLLVSRGSGGGAACARFRQSCRQSRAWVAGHGLLEVITVH
jgi:hypothetical protein